MGNSGHHNGDFDIKSRFMVWCLLIGEQVRGTKNANIEFRKVCLNYFHVLSLIHISFKNWQNKRDVYEECHFIQIHGS